MEIKRKKLELARVSLAKEELEFKILEKMEEVKRLEGMVEIQKNKQEELTKELADLEDKKKEE